MADKNLTFNIRADDDASKVFEKLSRTAKREMGTVEDSLDDTRTAGQRAADALSAVFDELDAEMAQTAAAADKLAAAMGPELAGKVDAGKAVAEFRKMGLSIDEVNADVDALAASLKKADDVSLKHFSGEADAAGASVRQLGSDSDQSRSVLANMVGNVSQDVGELGGIAGSTGVLIGQLGEYATEGNIKLRDLAKVAGPMALLSAGVSVATGIISDMKAEAAAAAARVDKFSDAIATSADDALGLADALRDDATAMRKFAADASTFGGLVGQNLQIVAENLPLVGQAFTDEGADIIAIANRVGLSIYDIAAAAEGIGSEGWRAYNRAADEALATGKITAEQHEALAQFIGDETVSLGRAREQQQLYNVNQAEANALLDEMLAKDAPLEQFTDQWSTLRDDMRDGSIDTQAAADAINFLADNLGITQEEVIALAQADLAGELEGAVEPAETLTGTFRSLGPTAAEVADAFFDQAAAINETVDAMKSAADAAIGVEEAQEGFIAAAIESAKVQADETASIEDKNEAVDDERDAMISAAEAAVRYAAEQAKAAGHTQTATEKIDTFNSSLFANARYATPAARQAIYDYIIEANNIPEEKATEIRAAVAAGDLELAESLVNNAPRAAAAAITADAHTADAEAQLNYTARMRSALINPQLASANARAAAGSADDPNRPRRAVGGPVRAGQPYIVGERGPELMVPSTNGTIIPNGNGAHPVGAGNTFINHIHMPATVSDAQVQRALRTYERRNGPT